MVLSLVPEYSGTLIYRVQSVIACTNHYSNRKIAQALMRHLGLLCKQHYTGILIVFSITVMKFYSTMLEQYQSSLQISDVP